MSDTVPLFFQMLQRRFAREFILLIMILLCFLCVGCVLLLSSQALKFVTNQAMSANEGFKIADMLCKTRNEQLPEIYENQTVREFKSLFSKDEFMQQFTNNPEFFTTCPNRYVGDIQSGEIQYEAYEVDKKKFIKILDSNSSYILSLLVSEENGQWLIYGINLK